MDSERRFISSGAQPGMVVRVISAVFGLLVIGAGIFFGFFVLMAALIFGLTMAAVFALRIWWIRRKLAANGPAPQPKAGRGQVPPDPAEVIEGEYKRVK